MTKPDWFILMEQWKPQRMGENGVTLPFLVGAIAYKGGKKCTGVPEIQSILDAISYHPMEGYFTFIFWCPIIGAPVLTPEPLNFAYKKGLAVISRPSGDESIAFGANLQSRWNSKDAKDLLNLLPEDAVAAVSSGNYSRRRKPGTVEYEYGGFTSKEIEYIERNIIQP
jgi:hypothetical protein